MRTTLTIDDDVLAAARQIADGSEDTVGAVISRLARQSLTARGRAEIRNGITLLPAAPGGRSATLDDVNRLRDDLS